MSEQEKKLDGPDFAQGVPLADVAESGIILGHVAGDAVLLARRRHELFAIGAECTHYHGPLAEGVLVEDTVRCPWHRPRRAVEGPDRLFDLRIGDYQKSQALPLSATRGASARLQELSDQFVRHRVCFQPSRRQSGPVMSNSLGCLGLRWAQGARSYIAPLRWKSVFRQYLGKGN
jgi:Rieske 2Fe-2S protein